MKMIFEINFPGDPSAGMHAYTEMVTILVASGQPGGEPSEFETHMREALCEWFDGATVSELGGDQ